MGGRFTLLLSLCSLPVCLNLPTTIHPLITRYCLLPPFPHCLFLLPPPFYSSSFAPAIHPSLHHSQSHLPPPLFFFTNLHLLSLPHAPFLLSCKVLPVHRLTLSLSCLEAITNLHGKLLNYVSDDDV